MHVKCAFLIISTPLVKIKRNTSWVLVCTYSEKYKESLILFSHTVINPGTVVIHLPDASFTNTAGRREKMLMHDTDSDNVINCGSRLHPICLHRYFQKHSLEAKGTCHVLILYKLDTFILTCSGAPSQAWCCSTWGTCRWPHQASAVSSPCTPWLRCLSEPHPKKDGKQTNVPGYTDTRKVSQYHAVKNGTIPHFVDTGTLKMSVLSEQELCYELHRCATGQDSVQHSASLSSLCRQSGSVASFHGDKKRGTRPSTSGFAEGHGLSKQTHGAKYGIISLA